MPNHETILAIIEKSQLVSSTALGELRKKLEQSPTPADLRMAVRWLVQKEHITSEQGRKLLAGQKPSTAPPEAEIGLAPMADDVAPRPKAAASPARPPDDEEDLELFPLDEQPPSAAVKPKAKPAAPRVDDDVDEELELFPVDEQPRAPAARPAAGKSPAAGKPTVERPAAANPPRWAGTPKPAVPATATPAPRAAKPRQAVPAADVFAGPSAGPAGGYFGGEEQFGQEERKPKPSRHERSIWDTPLLLIGGGSLLAMVLLGGLLYWALSRGNADQAFAMAEQDYKAGSYTQAIQKFDAFLENFPDDAKASTVKVHRGMAKMRQAVDGARDWSKTLDVAKAIIAEISTEKEFGEARQELVALLPKIAEGLANQAREKGDHSLVEKSNETLKLISKYVPKTMMPTQKVADITASLALTERILGRDAALEETLKGIQKAIAEGQPQAAYAERKQLLKNYPDLMSNEQLQKAVLSLSEAEREQVRYVAEAKQAAPAEAASPVEAEVVLANVQGGEAPGMAGRQTYALAGGAVFALQANDGKVLWRRFVGYDAAFLPQPLTLDPGSDVLVVDTTRQEIIRAQAANGEVRWRHALAEAFDADPVVSRDKVWVATRTGRIVAIDLESGVSPGYLQLPQGLRVGPAFDSRGQLYYQLGENSNLFVISAAGNECREVLYLGHEPESIRVPPLVVAPYIFVCENNGASDSVMHVLLTDAQGLSVRPAQASVQLSGHVMAPPVVAGRTLVVTTDRGAIYSFEINAPDPGPPLTKVAEKPAEDSAPQVRYALLRDAQLWVAGSGLTKFDIQSARGRLEPKWIHDEGDTFISAPTIQGEVVFHARREKNQSEVLVSAVKAGDGSRIWQTQLAAPPAGAPMTGKSAGKMTVMNTAGALFEIPTADLKGRVVQDRAVAATQVDRPFPEGVSPAVLADGRLALGADGQSKALIADESAQRELRWLSLPDPLGALPISFGGGLLTPGRLGQVFVLDAVTGRNLIAPFQPRLSDNEPYSWSQPARLGDHEVLLADGRQTLFRLGVAAQPQPNLVALATAELPGPVTAPLATLNQTAYAVDGAGELRSYLLPGLKSGPTWPIGGAQWGPMQVGSCALLLSRGDELACYDDQRQQVWKVAWPHGPLAGTALVSGEDFLLASVAGVIYRIAAGSGEERGRLDVGEPLGAGPVAVGDRLWLAGHGGTLLVVAAP